MSSGSAHDYYVPERARALFVLGMHRSGTSALTRVLSLLGMDLGADLLSPVAGNNDGGFWESKALVTLHRRLLAALGYSWFDVRALPIGWTEREAVVEIVAELASLLRGQFGESTLWGAKDPRMCRLFPVWRRALQDLDCDPYCVLMVRDPDAVARSLHARDRMRAGRSHLLWLRHVIEAEQATRGLARVFVTFDDLMTDWRAAVSKIEAGFGWRFPRSTAAAAQEIEDYLDTERHASARRRTPLEPAAASIPWVSRVYAAFQRARDGADIARDTDYTEVVHALTAAEPVFGPLLTELALHSDSRFLVRNRR